MKKNLIFLTLLLLASSGCSKTWSGIKQDSVDALDGTRDAIHEATAPSYPTSQNTSLAPLPSVASPEALTSDKVEVIKEDQALLVEGN